MKIIFRNKKLQKLCTQKKEMQKALGPEMARKLQTRMTELSAADTLEDMTHLPQARLHELSGDRKGQFSLDLKHPYRLLVVPCHDPVPQKADKGIDLSAVTVVGVVEIEDTHSGKKKR